MRNLSYRLLAATLAMLAASNAFAAKGSSVKSLDHNRFKWRDAQGNLHYTDSVPPEAARLGYDIVNTQGIVIKHVDRAKTEAELAASKLDAAKQAAERRVAEQRARDDEQLLSNYPREDDLKHAQQQELEMLEQQVKAAAASLRNQEQSLADLLDRAAEAERTGKELPAEQTTQLGRMRKQVDEQRMTVAQREHDRDEASSHFDEQVTHYRELKARLKPEAAQQP
jgi:hypothetical protein